MSAKKTFADIDKSEEIINAINVGVDLDYIFHGHAGVPQYCRDVGPQLLRLRLDPVPFTAVLCHPDLARYKQQSGARRYFQAVVIEVAERVVYLDRVE
jgi:hypothetical protein